MVQIISPISRPLVLRGFFFILLYLFYCILSIYFILFYSLIGEANTTSLKQATNQSCAFLLSLLLKIKVAKIKFTPFILKLKSYCTGLKA